MPACAMFHVAWGDLLVVNAPDAQYVCLRVVDGKAVKPLNSCNYPLNQILVQPLMAHRMSICDLKAIVERNLQS